MRNLRADERISIELRALYQQHGYLPYKANRFEEYDLYMRNKRFLMSENVLAFSDMDGKLMALRPDVTLSIIKNTADDGQSVKLSYAERVYRVPRGERSFKEIMQTGLEVIGEVDAIAMAEVLTLAEKSLAAISDRYALDVADLGVVSGIFEEEGLSEEAGRALLGCISGKNLNGLQLLCAQLGVGERTQKRLETLVTVYGPFGQTLAQYEQADLPPASRAALAGLREVYAMLEAAGAKHVNLDFSVVNDMNYYNGLIFAGFVQGVPSSVLSGGRYDRLMQRMGKRAQAMGFAVYLDQLGRLLRTGADWDVDLLITYTKASDAQAVFARAQSERMDGKSVRVQRAGETALRARDVIAL